MRILYLTEQYTPHDFRFLNSLAETENEIFSMQLSASKFHRESRKLPQGVTPLENSLSEQPFSWFQSIAYRDAIRKHVAEIKPEVVHAGPIQHVAFFAVMNEVAPVLTMSWGSDLLVSADSNPINKWITSYTLSHSAGLVGDCQPVKEKALAFGMQEEDIFLFPWGIDLQQFSPAANSEIREQLGWQNQFVILSNRSWESLYGVDTVVNAFINASKHTPELRLLLLGTGSMKEQITQLIETSGVKDQVHLAGQISNDQLPDYYHASDLYISASYSDGSSVSLMEALACELPALVSDIPGNREWVTETVEGWRFTAGDVDELTRKILDTYGLRDSLDSIKAAARHKAEIKADWSHNFHILLNAYQHVVEKSQKEMH